MKTQLNFCHYFYIPTLIFGNFSHDLQKYDVLAGMVCKLCFPVRKETSLEKKANLSLNI